MPSLNWIGKEAVVNHDKEVPFKLLEKIPNASVGKESKNLIIHGDNLEALKALMPFYKGRVRCIYIDPPYNTGNEGWVYSDAVNSSKIREWLGKVVGPEAQDLTRHDKWLCMMYPRLKLLRDLLAENGTIFISIDDNEFSSLRFIMNEVFGEYNFVANFVWKSKGSGAYDTKAIKTEHEYILCFAKQIERVTFAQIPFDTTQDLQYTHSDSRLSLSGKYKRQAMAMGTHLQILTEK
jgi:adenine specific DNA methylase Mod